MERQARVDMDLSISRLDPEWQALPIAGGGSDAIDGLLTRALEAVLAGTPLPAGLAARGCEVSLVLTDDAGIREMNRTWRGIDKATDVLSFPGDDGFAPPEQPLPLGDIVLARQTLLRDAAELRRDLPHHLSHIAVHGLLHLLGWDHEDAAEAELMEAQERRILEQLGYADEIETTGDNEEDGGGGTPA
ncbi:rRNA maturation RNase YbeY [Marinibaculum pumilum]|uniref:Endoribonuclease YbeY n=1 Tax=Marinibaculum pumilum TaxID=1766165 RepID=A0ABV7L5Y3_9PROT